MNIRNVFAKRGLAVMLGASLMALVSISALAIPAKGNAPDFTLKSNRGSNVKLSEHRGEVIMINFWASWCAPCRKEMPLLEDLYQRYKDGGFTLLGVNVEEDSSAAKDLLKDVRVSFPILFDNQNKVSQLYNVEAMPSTVILDRNGKVRFVHKGYQPGYEDEYQKQVRELIME